MKLDKVGIDFIRNEEGFNLKAYQDSVGVWTILWGLTYNPFTGDKIKQGDSVKDLPTAELWWQKAISPFETVVTNSIPTGMTFTQNNFNACVSLCWNIGRENFKNSSLVKRLIDSSIMIKIGPHLASDTFKNILHDAIAYEFLVWHNAGGKINVGLVSRRKREITLYFS